MACFRSEAGAIVLSLRLTPRSSRDAIEGIGRLSDGSEVALVRVRALPEAGAANAAVTQLLARTFRVPKSAVTIVSGGRGRHKQARIAGDPPDLARIVESWPRSD